MDDFLASRKQVVSSRQGSAQSGGGGAASPFGTLAAEVRTAAGTTDPGRIPEIETVVVNGRIRRIHIHCKCGEEIILHCDYPA